MISIHGLLDIDLEIDAAADPRYTTLANMRLPYVQDPPQTNCPDEARVFTDVQERRAPHPLLQLDLTLLHSFPITEGWNSFYGAIRTRTSLSTVIREISICRIAVVNNALYEWEQHVPLLKQGGLSEEALELVKDVNADFNDDYALQVLSQDERIVLKYTDAMTKLIRVPDDIFDELKQCFGHKEIVEITATVAGYNAVSRFLVALDVGERNAIQNAFGRDEVNEGRDENGSMVSKL